MKIDFDTPILDLTGTPLMEKTLVNGEPKDVPITIGSITAGSLLTPLPADQNMSGKDKADLFNLALRVYKGVVDLSIEDVAKIKDRVGKTHNNLAVGRVWQILEGTG